MKICFKMLDFLIFTIREPKKTKKILKLHAIKQTNSFNF